MADYPALDIEITPPAGDSLYDRLYALLDDYQPYHAARADLLARAGRHGATAAYDRAIDLTTNPAERRFLERQRKAAERT